MEVSDEIKESLKNINHKGNRLANIVLELYENVDEIKDSINTKKVVIETCLKWNRFNLASQEIKDLEELVEILEVFGCYDFSVK